MTDGKSRVESGIGIGIDETEIGIETGIEKGIEIEKEIETRRGKEAERGVVSVSYLVMGTV